MTPLERMAKAHWAESENCRWENLTDEDRAHLINVMRAALLALAEGELDDEMLDTCGLTWGSGGGAFGHDKHNFKAIIRAIAKEKTT